MPPALTYRQEAEAIEALGDELAKLMRDFDRLVPRMSPGAIDGINAIPDQENLDTVANAFQALGARLSALCDEADEARDRDRMISVGGHRDGGSAS